MNNVLIITALRDADEETLFKLSEMLALLNHGGLERVEDSSGIMQHKEAMVIRYGSIKLMSSVVTELSDTDEDQRVASKLIWDLHKCIIGSVG